MPIDAYFTPQEYADILGLAGELGMSLGGLIREMALMAFPRYRFEALEKARKEGRVK